MAAVVARGSPRFDDTPATTLETIQGVSALQFLPRCAALVQYGGGDDMRTGEALLSVPLSPSAIPCAILAAVPGAVDRALARKNAGGPGNDLAREYLPATWDRNQLIWEAALAVCTEPSFSSAGRQGWANVYFHGWLFSDAVEEAQQGSALLSAAQRYPLVGVFAPSEGIGAWGGGGDDGGAFCNAAGKDVRSAGAGGELEPADQHIHTVDAFAGGDREGTVALYVSEGYDRATAEAIVDASVESSGEYHVGSDAARVSLNPALGGSCAWCVCVSLPPPPAAAAAAAAGVARATGILPPPPPPKAHATLLVALPSPGPGRHSSSSSSSSCCEGADAAWFRRWSPSSSNDVAAARAELTEGLHGACLGIDVADRVRAALRAT